jgi:hypothetical protein
MVILDHIGAPDLAAYRNVVQAMPDAGQSASGVLTSVCEIRAWPRHGLLQFFYGCKVLHGSADGIVPRPTNADLIEDIRTKASANLFDARHYLLYPHDHSKVVHKLPYHFKNCFYALQSWMLLQSGQYFALKDDILGQLSDADDREVIRVARDWAELEQDRGARPLYYIELLERWGRKMLSRLAAYEQSERPKVG